MKQNCLFTRFARYVRVNYIERKKQPFDMHLFLFTFQASTFLCKVCTDQYFPKRWMVLRHLQEQHSGFAYKCNVCGRVLARATRHGTCSGKYQDMELVHRCTGQKGREAERLYKEYRMNQMPEQWEELFSAPTIPQKVSPLPQSPPPIQSPVKSPSPDIRKRKLSMPDLDLAVPAKKQTTSVNLDEDINWDPVEIQISEPVEERYLLEEFDIQTRNVYFASPVRTVQTTETEKKDQEEQCTKSKEAKEKEKSEETEKEDQEEKCVNSKEAKEKSEKIEKKDKDENKNVKNQQDPKEKGVKSKQVKDKSELNEKKDNTNEKEIIQPNKASEKEKSKEISKDSKRKEKSHEKNKGKHQNEKDSKGKNKKPNKESSEESKEKRKEANNPLSDESIQDAATELSATNDIDKEKSEAKPSQGASCETAISSKNKRSQALAEKPKLVQISTELEENRDFYQHLNTNLRLKFSEASELQPRDTVDVQAALRQHMQTLTALQRVQEKRVILNIGGQRFTTSEVTLRADPHSIFNLMFVEGCPLRPSSRIYYFDRDPSHFRLILNYLRNGAHLDSCLLPHEKRYLLEILTEARFFCLEGLVRIVKERLKQTTGTDQF